MGQFWIVMSNDRGPSSMPCRHITQQSAIDEALRLTRANGGSFFVLEAVFEAKRNDVQLRRLADGDDIPF